MNKNQETWNKSNAKKLFDCFMEVEKNQYPEYFHEKLDERAKLAEKFIIEFGNDNVRINNYTNMMLFSSAVILDTYIFYDELTKRHYNIDLNIGSEPHEIWATNDRNQKFDFDSWEWKEI